MSWAAHDFSLLVLALRSALFWLGLLDLVALDDQTRPEWRRLSIVLLHGSAFVSLYSLAFEITRGYTIDIIP